MTTGHKILLVEDSSSDAALMQEAFRSERFPHEVHLAEDGVQAKELLVKWRDAGETPVLVVLDLGIPKISGLQLLEFMRADRLLKYVPVIVFTGNVDPGVKQQAMLQGANLFVRKPQSADDFLEFVRQLSSLVSHLD